MTAAGVAAALHLEELAREHYLRLLADVGSAVWIDYPDHPNVGDSLIWLGERKAMRSMGVQLRAALPTAISTPDVIRRTVGRYPESAVCLHGGGNFGGLYAQPHQARLAAIGAAEGRRLVQAPQSVHFASERAQSELVHALQAQKDKILAVRDLDSQERLKGAGLASLLMPDSAHVLGVVDAPAATQRALILRRTDIEAVASEQPPAAVSDWMDEGRLSNASSRLRGRAYARSNRGRAPHVLPAVVLDAVASVRMRRGVRALAPGKVVVTDRLHAMILAIHMGRPVVAVDNAVGKLSSYWRTWLEPAGADVTFAETWREALRAC